MLTFLENMKILEVEKPSSFRLYDDFQTSWGQFINALSKIRPFDNHLRIKKREWQTCSQMSLD